ncbi:ATP-binding protein [Brevundimonas bullata]|uniref:ATP-binding protein n=1 Tax=Brevundimonas bullata TaxID=13160 RepID=UPI002FDA3B9C
MVASGMIAASLRWTEQRAREDSDAAAAVQAGKHERLLAVQMQKFRLLPLALGEYPDVHAVLARPDAGTVARLNVKLELLAERTNASAIYVLDGDGLTVAASNWRQSDSFVGQNFGFRPYFKGAMAQGEAELFALGAISALPGLFIAHRISEEDGAAGVVVVKIDLAHLEEQWANEPGVTLVVNPDGVIILTSREPWRFRTLHTLSEAQQASIQRTLQFGNRHLQTAGIVRAGNGDVRLPGEDGLYRATEMPSGLGDAVLTYFEPLAPARERAAAQARVFLVGGLALITLLSISIWWMNRRRLMQAEAQRRLEHEVFLRTAELRQANDHLLAESQKRIAADERWRAAREELAQANRLGSIGQITAGVVHEINQPAAAIRAFAQNVVTYLRRGEDKQAHEGLSNIMDLTDRIGRITAELRSFARRRAPAVRKVRLDTAIDGALLLIGDRLREQRIRLDRPGFPLDLHVIADRIRLEQIIINLIQNAIDALEAVPEPCILLRVEPADDVVLVDVADNGSGIAPDLVETIFAPFVSGKPDGLGLGLGIAQDIAREFDGNLEVIPSPLGGAAFRITLRRA